MASEEGVPVELYIYDLTNGLASLLSPAIIGRQVEGVWHTSVVVYEREYFYGGGGVITCAPGSTQLGAPHQVERLGTTFVPFQVFVDYIQGLATTTYTAAQYRLLEHNCNHFSEEVAQFLCGGHVPKHIVAQPERDLPPPLRLALTAMLDKLTPDADHAVYANGVRHSRRESPDFLTLNTQIEEARAVSAELDARRNTLAEKLARKERRREKKRRKQRRAGDQPDLEHEDEGDMADAVEAEVAVAVAGPSAGAGGAGGAACAADVDERLEEEQRRRARDPPIIFKDIDGAAEYEKLSKALEGAELSPEEKQSLDELQQYLVQGEGSWVLGDDFLSFIGRLLSDEALGSAVRCAALRCLAAGALRDDVSLLLHQDRRHHALLSYAHNIDREPLDEQRAIGLFMCNLFENTSSSEWLLYISEWENNGRPLSNIRVTTKVCVHCLLGEDPALREVGTALLYNIATKEVKTVSYLAGSFLKAFRSHNPPPAYRAGALQTQATDDIQRKRLGLRAALRARFPAGAKHKVFDEVCVELCMAALQLLGGAPDEPALWRALAALARLAQHSPDVPQLIAVVGPDPAAYRGTSPRVDEQIDLIMKKMK